MKVAILSDFPLHFLPGFSDSPAGKKHWSTWLPQLAGQFENEKTVEFHWILLSEEVAELQTQTFRGQVFHVLPTLKTGRASSLYRADRREIQRLLQQLQPDVVHGWGSEDVYGLAAVQSGFPSIVSMQGILSFYTLKNRFPLRTYFQALVELYILRKASLITVESEWGREILRRRLPKNPIELVEYGVQDHFLTTEWNPDPKKPVVVFVGSISPRKGIQDAIEAFKSPELAHAELWIIGEIHAGWPEELEKSSSANTKWLGQIDSLAIAEKMSQGWCLVLPTRADTSPNVVKEARVIGLPVISTKHGGQTAYVIDEKTGFIVEAGEVADLRKRLVQLTNDFALCQKLGKALHKEQSRLLHPARTSENFLRLYKKVTVDPAL